MAAELSASLPRVLPLLSQISTRSVRDDSRLTTLSSRKLGVNTPRGNAVLLDSVTLELSGIADSLASWAQSLKSENGAAAKALTYHAEALRVICGLADKQDEEDAVLSPPSEGRHSLPHLSSARSARRSTRRLSLSQLQQDEVLQKLMERENSRQLSVDEVTFREKAALVLQASGQEGEAVDDLEEVQVAQITDKLAISYWRFCQGLRLYRSPTVTEAMRLICSAAVPGLGGTTYLEVFETLTQSTAWEQHIYIFGGLVRDVLRRTVGNDIDIGFSAPACELEAACKLAGYQNQVDGDYIIIGDENGEEYLEGMVISFNGIQPPEHADFSMNTLFYDFKNDVVVDKTGRGVDAVLQNRLELPCPADRWKSWVEINGVRVCFRYYKFLLRGYSFRPEEMRYVAEILLDFWRREAEHTIEVGKVALKSLVSCKDEKKVERLRELVFQSFEMAQAGGPESVPARRRPGRALSCDELAFCRYLALPEFQCFLSARTWWEKGWLVLLELEP